MKYSSNIFLQLLLLPVLLLSGCVRHQSEGYGWQTIDDIKDKRIGVMLASVQDNYVTNNFTKAQVLRMDHTSDVVMALKTNQCDAIILPEPEVKLVLRSESQFVVLAADIFGGDVGMGFRDAALRDRFDVWLGGIKETGLHEEILNRWLSDPENSSMPEISFAPDARPLTLGTSAQSMPFSFMKEGKVVGLDIELISRFAADAGYYPRFELMNFGGLLPAVATGRVDVMANGVMITEERSKQMLFSAPYYFAGSSALILKKNLSREAADLIEPHSAISVIDNQSVETSQIREGFFQRVKKSFYSNLVLEKRWKLILEGLWTTLIITFFATILGTLIGGAVCAMRMNRRKTINGVAKLYINIMRGTPVLVILMILFYVIFASTGLSAVAVAVITFALNMGAYSSEMFRTSIEGVDKGQKEAGIAIGFTKVQTFRYIVLPQAARSIMPVYKGEIISMLKMTSIVGYIAVLDLTKASDIIRSRTFDAFFPLIFIAIVYFILAWLIGWGLDRMNGRISAEKSY